MINIVVEKRNMSAADAVASCISDKIMGRIVNTGWGDIALGLWGHGDPERTWKKLDDPVINLQLNRYQMDMLGIITETMSVSPETAVSYFLIFSMEELGYHI